MLEQRDRWRVSEMHRCNWDCTPGYDLSVCAVHASLYPSLSIPLSRDCQLCGPISAMAIPGKSHAFLFYLPRFARISVFLFIIQRRINGLVIYMIVARANFVNLPSTRDSFSLSLFMTVQQKSKAIQPVATKPRFA